jgi:CRP-like cAMP-binding protein
VLLTSRRTADVIAETAVRALAIPASALARPEYAQVTEGISGAMIRDDWVKY